ncbi:hypothetical protein [Myroides sp. N17-2]|uniref:hypothetical protein n=1 Tax=Myroides sp. N17-2 TaxID=2030799 RepID=UPI000EFC2D39|nr:hypothetical protein [Myroides sp. N17-2]
MMKKYFKILSITLIALVISNCSSDDNKNKEVSNNLIKKLEVRTTMDSPETASPNSFFFISNTTFNYNQRNQTNSIHSQQDYRNIWEYNSTNNQYPNKREQKIVVRIFTYNTNTNLLEKETTTINNVTTIKTFIYNDKQQIVTINEVGKTTTLKYNTKGQVSTIITKYTDPDNMYNAIKEYEYDQSNNLISVNYIARVYPDKINIKYTNIESPYKGTTVNYSLLEPMDEGILMRKHNLFSDKYATFFENLEYSYKGYHLIKSIIGTESDYYDSTYLTSTENFKPEGFDYFRGGKDIFAYYAKKTY